MVFFLLKHCIKVQVVLKWKLQSNIQGFFSFIMKSMNPENEGPHKKYTAKGKRLHSVFDLSYFAVLYMNQESLELFPESKT